MIRKRTKVLHENLTLNKKASWHFAENQPEYVISRADSNLNFGQKMAHLEMDARLHSENYGHFNNTIISDFDNRTLNTIRYIKYFMKCQYVLGISKKF